MEPDNLQAEWTHVAQQLPNQPVISVEVGDRELDAQYPWDENADRYEDVDQIVRFLETKKQNVETEQRMYETSAVQFTAEHEQIFDIGETNSIGKRSHRSRMIVSRLVIIQGKRKKHLCRLFLWVFFSFV